VGEAGKLPRRLGIGVVPVQGESFPSWVDRMAARMGTSRGWVIRQLGIELVPNGARAVWPLRYGISMSRSDLDAVRSATGAPPEQVRAMLLSAYDGTVLDMSALGRGLSGYHAGARAWGLFRGSRCCPDCVAAGDGAWQLWWRLGGAVACPEHSALLYGRCPRCRLPLRQDLRFPVRFPFPADGPSVCVNWRADARAVCGFPLKELPPRPVTAAVLDVQDSYLRAAAGQPLRLAGKEVTPAWWFAEMSQLVAFARLVGPQEVPCLEEVLSDHAIRAWRDDHAAGEAAPRRQWKGCPPSPELMAALLQVLSPALGAASEPELRDAASWLISAVYRRTPRWNRNLQSLPPITRRAFMASQHRGRANVLLPRFLQAEPDLASQGLTAAHVPSYADRDDVLEQLSPYLAPKRGSRAAGWPLRRFAALSLMFLVSDAQTWDDAAEQLGVPLAYGNQHGWALVTDWLAFREGLIVLGSRLVQRGLVDYRARRAALSGLTEMPAVDWAARPSTTSKPGVCDRGRICAAAWIWSELTGGRYDESPAWAAHPEFGAGAYRSSRYYLKWESDQGPVRRNWLRSWGAGYLEEQSCRGTLR
jgi:TniQ